MYKTKISAAAVLLITLIGAAPLTATAPLSVSAATMPTTTTKAVAVTNNTIKVKSENVKLLFDGVSLQPPVGQHVFIYNNTTYVPLRFMSYALQKSVSWDAKNLKVTVAEPSNAELVVIKEYLMNATNGNDTSAETKNVVLSNVKASYVFNGSAKSLPASQASFISNGNLYVPLRFLSESVGTSISWNQKTKTITAASKGYQEQPVISSTPQPSNGTDVKVPGATPAATSKPAPTATTDAAKDGASGGGAGAGTQNGKVSYEAITSETEAKLTALRSESQSTLVSTAFEYLAATDDASRASIKAKGKQQLASFTGSFNSIVADAEQKLTANGYSTAIISEYRKAFESEILSGLDKAKGMAD